MIIHFQFFTFTLNCLVLECHEFCSHDPIGNQIYKSDIIYISVNRFKIDLKSQKGK